MPIIQRPPQKRSESYQRRLAALQGHSESYARRLAEIEEKKHSALATFGRKAAQVPLLGFGDEIVGAIRSLLSPDKSVREGIQQERDTDAAMSRQHPTASKVGTVTGYALPIGGAGSLALKTGKSVLSVGARAGAAGAAVGAAEAIGGQEGSLKERVTNWPPGNMLPTVVKDALLAGGTAALVPMVGAAAPRLRGATRGKRVVEAVERESDVMRTINQAYREAAAAIKKARVEHYAPLEAKYPTVSDPEITTLIRSPEYLRHTRKVNPAVAKGQDPSFEDLQAIRSRIKNDLNDARKKGETNKFKDAERHVKELNELLYRKIDGFEAADAAFARAAANERAIAIGRRAASPRFSSEDVHRLFLDRITDPKEQQLFRQGYVYESVRKLDKGDAQYVRRLLQADPEMKRQLRTMFPSDDGYQRFMKVLARERSAERISSAFTRFGGRVVEGVAIGGAFYGMSKLFGRSGGGGGNPSMHP
jgi:hypothetical protein